MEKNMKKIIACELKKCPFSEQVSPLERKIGSNVRDSPD